MRRVLFYTEIFTNKWVFDSVKVSSDLPADISRNQRISYEQTGKSPAFVRITYIITESDCVSRMSEAVLRKFCQGCIAKGRGMEYIQLMGKL